MPGNDESVATVISRTAQNQNRSTWPTAENFGRHSRTGGLHQLVTGYPGRDCGTVSGVHLLDGQKLC
jgi:hypothetical protein